MVEPARVSIRTVLFWAILAAQLLVPILQLGEPRPARFGWQMFSGVGRPAEFEVESADGTIHPVDLDELLARPRPEMDLPRTLPPRLCRQFREADLVRTRFLMESPRERETRCP